MNKRKLIVLLLLISVLILLLYSINLSEQKYIEQDIVEQGANEVKDAMKYVELQPPKEEVEEVVEPQPYFYLSDYERSVVESIVMGESGYTTYKNQLLVAQCLVNACITDDLQPSEVRSKYKYSGWHEKPTQSVKQAVTDVFDNGYKVVDEPILWFYAPKYCDSSWHESQQFVIEEGGHRFFMKK